MSLTPKEGELVEIVTGDDEGQYAWLVGEAVSGRPLVGLRDHPQRGIIAVESIRIVRFCPHEDCQTELTAQSGRNGNTFWWCWRCERTWKAGERRYTKICPICKIPKLKTGNCFTCPECGC